MDAQRAQEIFIFTEYGKNVTCNGENMYIEARGRK